ncbi:hypothetical protein J4573_36725 [Actinomadura barringtoniae]|uniref:Uncharacterized protein n=1 Tax=Actinomadura barringtoniae TaxID=1427535 RepID=A0A939PHD4_9ACTN|nr:hypothetical protein [Actinomadura barringtoniae]MBO2452685.1 hypothetical protein [Actinomadura barringtoniae]
MVLGVRVESIVRVGAGLTAVLIAVGGYAMQGRLDFYRPGTPSWTGLVVALVATAVGVGGALAVARHLATPVLLLVALPICGLLIHNAAESRVLAIRGVTADCRIADVRSTSRNVANGAPENGSSKVTTSTHRLTCPPGGPSVLKTKKAAGRAGSSVAVSWDPRGRVDPRPAADVPHGSELILPSLAVLAVLLLAATADPAAFRRDRPTSPERGARCP